MCQDRRLELVVKECANNSKHYNVRQLMERYGCQSTVVFKSRSVRGDCILTLSQKSLLFSWNLRENRRTLIQRSESDLQFL